jgi:hypothetical protein
MSYLRFVDQADGVHVFFDDVSGTTDPTISFDETELTPVLSRTQSHTVQFSIDFVPGVGNDVVKITIDGNLVHTGTSWENYYRFSTEQAGNNNLVPSVDKLMFVERGTAAAGNVNKGYLVDGVTLKDSTPTP